MDDSRVWSEIDRGYSTGLRWSTFLSRCGRGGNFPNTHLSFDFDVHAYYTRRFIVTFSLVVNRMTIPITSGSSGIVLREILQPNFQKFTTRLQRPLQNLSPPTAMVSNDKFLGKQKLLIGPRMDDDCCVRSQFEHRVQGRQQVSCGFTPMWASSTLSICTYNSPNQGRDPDYISSIQQLPIEIMISAGIINLFPISLK
jgi:hypothetical protein